MQDSSKIVMLNIDPTFGGWVDVNRANSRTFAEHSHRELELNLVRSGSCIYVVDGKRIDLKISTMIWFYPAQRHILLERSPDFEMFIAVFDEPLLREFCGGIREHALLQERPSGPSYKCLGKQTAKTLDGNLSKLLGQQQSLAFRFRLGAVLYEAWEAFEMANLEPDSKHFHPAIEKTLHLLNGEGSDWSLNELAKAVHLSPTWLSRHFKKLTGMALVDYRNRLRLEKFQCLYERKAPTTLLAMALEAGFGSYAQFHRVHLAMTGRSPREPRGIYQE